MFSERERLRQIVTTRLESLQLAGVLHLPRPVRNVPPIRTMVPEPADVGNTEPETTAPAATAPPTAGVHAPPLAPGALPAMSPKEPGPAPARVETAQKKTSHDLSPMKSLFETPTASAPLSAAANGLTLAVLQQSVAACTRCSQLAATRTQTVFGVGNPKARLCFLGEAPGADEDEQGVPFVGRGGQLLNKIIAACNLTREEVYILNMIKCRPPNNRNPLPNELANCREYLEAQLGLIQPEFICCLGAVASQNLLGTTVSIGKLRGKIHSFRGAKVVCTYHPAFLLRSPSYKQQAWDDMKMLMREMGVNL